MKYGHRKTRLDEFPRVAPWDDISMEKYIKKEFSKMICRSTQVPVEVYNCIGPKPAHIDPFFELQPHERKILEKRIKRFKKESPKVSKGIEKFRKSVAKNIIKNT